MVNRIVYPITAVISEAGDRSKFGSVNTSQQNSSRNGSKPHKRVSKNRRVVVGGNPQRLGRSNDPS
jgi:hypothetical protein